MAKKSGSKPMTKTEIMRSISETTGLQKKDVVAPWFGEWNETSNQACLSALCPCRTIPT